MATAWADACVSTVLNLVPGDVDWFVLDLDQPSRLAVDVDSLWYGYDSLDAMLGLWDEAVEVITIIDDWDGLDPFIEVDLSPGRYYVAVTGYGDMGEDWGFEGKHFQEGEYELRFTVDPIATTVDAYVQGTYLHMFARGLGDPDLGSGTRGVVFDVGWHESWRGPDRPAWVEAEDNWDAVWLFAKFRELGGAWRHATLAGAYAPSGAAVDVPADGRGAFLYRPEPGYGEPEHDGYFGAEEVALTWAYEADGVAADAVLEVRVFGIEMVYVPEGAFYAGSGGTGRGEFREGGTTGEPFLVDAQGTIALGSEAGELDWAEEGFSGTPEGSTDPGFPTGFGAFYVMKYELTQGQYAAFLNTLTQEQANNRRYYEWGARFALEGDAVGEYWSWLPHVPLNFATWADGAAFADWAGLRPMTELEFEKAARGPLDPVPDEYAWGSTEIRFAQWLEDADTHFETASPSDANTNVGSMGYPIRVGAFAAPGKSRENAGTGYYGALDLTGNLWENVVTIGLPEGRAFSGQHGDGALDGWGDANVDGWPGPSALGAGFRGGDFADGEDRARTSDRIDVAQEKAWHDGHHGWRGVRTAP
jgi:formylglycine-generating enzyme required for sulfatase activity